MKSSTNSLIQSPGYHYISSWLLSKEAKPFTFQLETWEAIHQGQSGLVNAPTGFGKTFSVFLGTIIRYINEHPSDFKKRKNIGLQLLWISPLRALGKDIARAMMEALAELDIPWSVGIRNGDTPTSEREKQKRRMPEILLITPESLHLLLASKGYASLFSELKVMAVDEWHELLGSKRGVQVELAIARIIGIRNAACKKSNAAEEIRNKKSEIPVLKVEPDGIHAELQHNKSEHAPLVNPADFDIEEEPAIHHSTCKIQHVKQIHSALPSVWGLSATIGNLEEAMEVLLYPIVTTHPGKAQLIQANLTKKTTVLSVFPDEMEKYPWAGHLGLKLADKVIDLIQTDTVNPGKKKKNKKKNKDIGLTDTQQTDDHSLSNLRPSTSTLIFINTRGMSENWYQQLLSLAPDLAGAIALHHSSIDQPLRVWVEEALHTGKLQAVVCTASLDLGVDFRPVNQVIQVGSPKGVARFLQRAGRSGHQPGATSVIHFVPTHSLELLEAAALKEAISNNQIESREPFILSFDVLIQFLCTLAVSDGFAPAHILPEIRSTHAFRDMTDEEWNQVLRFITLGGQALHQYDDFKKVEIENGVYRILNRRIAMRHRLSIGTIVSDAMMKVKWLGGGFIGSIEEWFISRLNPGDVFTLAGRNLEFVMIKDMTVLVKKTQSSKSIVPSWMGGRMPLSANLGKLLRKKLDDVSRVPNLPDTEPELAALAPLFQLQRELSHLPRANELLIEHIETEDGFHLFVYPFEGRLVHEALALLLAWRISRFTPITFSIAMNDYGLELLSDQPIPLDDSNAHELLSEKNLQSDILQAVNATEMARRKFRDIAVIGGLIFPGMPGEQVRQRHLQSSAGLLFNVFTEYEPDNLLLQQAYREVMEQQMEEGRLRNMLQRISKGEIIIRFPERLTPFSFPIKVDSLRETLSSEKLEHRIRKMLAVD